MCRARLAATAFGVAAAMMSAAGGAVAQARPQGRPPRSALIVFFDGDGARPPAGAGLSVGLVSAAQQGPYGREQFLLDASQGARAGAAAYGAQPGPLRLQVGGAAGARIAGWQAARRRAAAAAGRLQ